MSSSTQSQRALNFGAGPGMLPVEVLEQAQKELLNFKGTGKSIMELSHRGKEFETVLEDAKNDLRTLLTIPKEYDILFLQGGASSLFAGIPMNLCKDENDVVDYIVTGSWSKSAFQEGKLYCKANKVVDMEPQKFHTVLPAQEWKFSEHPAYIQYCDNETIHGIEFPGDDITSVLSSKGVPIVCDMSSNFLSRSVDISRYDLVFAGAQKNAGISGITIVIIKNTLLSKTKSNVPSVFNFSKKSQMNSLDNTPPTFNIYVTGLILKWIIKQGGIKEMERRNKIKADTLYSFIDNSNGFYTCKIDPKYRSKMNVVFRIKDNPELEDKFAKEAEKHNITDIKGHRSVGGLRASLYNAVTIDATNQLVSFMDKFMKENQ
ncbi:phosphoserine transaminase [Tieghemostelium lacteum]|uniref:Phosphoserine aminotransferase n=1 Tax=Tieghemostelium lacteum TaxID=361077 RepID=A0A151ZS67_TIELA|nr:phosphoserine transaminase [Tieghemostelium lacteum]|eukprot:KYQ96770.1 phosphoserine transaminase [Tieghemostelium lacteum]